jgi:putative endonuclease
MRNAAPLLKSSSNSSWSVYLLKCSDNSYYVGCTSNLNDRLNRHALGKISYTKPRRPLELVVFTTFQTKYKAYAFEKYLKSGSGRAFSKRHFIE